MTRKAPLYELAPVTASTAQFLASVYGASSIERFAESFPRSARVLDVGAGNSELGSVVAPLRPDVTWTNLDLRYTPDELRRLRAAAPPNLEYLSGNILEPGLGSADTYDRVYAFWVLPHIGLEDPDLIRVSVANMLTLLNPQPHSRLVVGPLVGKRTGSAGTTYLTAELTKGASAEEIAKVVTASTVPQDQRWLYRAMNRSGLMILKNGQRTGQKPTRLGLWDFKTRKYVDVFSVRGVIALARFRIYLAVEKLRSFTTTR